MEQKFGKEREEAEKKFEKQIEDLRIEGMQIYTNTKIKM